MMMKKMIYGGFILLLIQIGLAVIMFSGESGLEAETADQSFFEFSSDDITSLQITDNEDNMLNLVKADGRWVMKEASNAPADENLLTSLFDKLISARAGLAVATSAGSAKRFKTAKDEFERHVLLNAGEKTVADFYLGTSAGFRHSHVRKAGEDSVFSIPVSNFELSAQPSDWLEKSLARVEPEKLQRVEYGNFVLVKQEDGWKLNAPLSGEADPEQIEALLDALTGLTVRDVYAADEVSPIFAGDSDLSYRLIFTDDTEKDMKLAKYDDAYVLKMSDSDLFFKVESWQVDKISEFQAASLIKEKGETADAEASAPAGQE
ncbi:MAG: DUF4340 domain-containing protein [Desulfocapsaceae bacterium]|nr:DUF4340 domain-containing protein [Desulfocapsaceae bacterium]